MRVVGVDGCPGGWVAIVYDMVELTLQARFHPSIVHVLDSNRDATKIGIDIPIGLNDEGPRLCDLAARKAISPRGSSVFPAPHPRVLFESTYEDAKARSQDLTGKMLSKQAFNIRQKIAEVNWAMEWEDQNRVFEIHPEVSFWGLAGTPMKGPKDKPEGYEERRAPLATALGVSIWPRNVAFEVARPAQPDDLLDATVAAWTARRVAEGTAERFPVDPPVDRRGLRMEIVY